MATLLTDQMLEEFGSDRFDRICHEVGILLGERRGPLPRGGVAHRICAEFVERFFELTSGGVDIPNTVAAIAMSSLRTGYALAYDQIDRDRAAVEALTGAEAD